MKIFSIFILIFLSFNCLAEGKFSALTDVDRNFLNQQYESINDLAKLQLGTELHKDKTDLDVLQKIIDRKLIDKTDVLKQQAMGTVLGEVLKNELGLNWVVWEDSYGRTRALRLGNTDHMLFPNTMISRRIKVDLDVNVQELYQRNYDVIYKYKINPQLQKRTIL